MNYLFSVGFLFVVGIREHWVRCWLVLGVLGLACPNQVLSFRVCFGLGDGSGRLRVVGCWSYTNRAFNPELQSIKHPATKSSNAHPHLLDGKTQKWREQTQRTHNSTVSWMSLVIQCSLTIQMLPQPWYRPGCALRPFWIGSTSLRDSGNPRCVTCSVLYEKMSRNGNLASHLIKC